MDHPLLNESSLQLRRRVVDFFKNGFFGLRSSNIVFVCGGNSSDHMRQLFRAEFSDLLDGYVFFQPEFAMNDYFSSPSILPFDIADFEVLVGELACAIVIFPEAPGSYAETGYFSATPLLAKKTLLALDLKYQPEDSFISLGPAKKFDENSVFSQNIQISYDSPDFMPVASRIKQRAKLSDTRKAVSLKAFSELSAFEQFCLIFEIHRILNICTSSDLLFILRSIFNGQISPERVKQITSILVGANALRTVGQFGHLTATEANRKMWFVRDGQKITYTELLLEISNLPSSPEFLAVIAEAGHAA